MQNFYFVWFKQKSTERKKIQNKGLCIIKALEMFDNFVISI